MEPKKPPRHLKGGYVNPSKLPKGPNGRALCRQCQTEVPKNRRTFCSQPCIDLWMVRTGSGMEKFIKKRDKGICAICGLDCEALKKKLRSLGKVAPIPELRFEPSDYSNEFTLTAAAVERWEQHSKAKQAAYQKAKEEVLAFKTEHAIPQHRSRLWDIDHIVPVIEGGGSCDPSNLRVLCLPCHKAETAKLAARRAATRKNLTRIGDDHG